MRKSVIFSTMLTVGVAVGILGVYPGFGQSDDEPIAPISPAEALKGDSATLREQYLKLATERARNMTEAQLVEAITVLQRQQNESEAEAKVRSALEILEGVTCDYPGTRWATIAKSGIAAVQQQINLPQTNFPLYSSGTFGEPSSDAFSEPVRSRGGFKRSN